MGDLSIFWGLLWFLSSETWSSCHIDLSLVWFHFIIVCDYCEGCHFPNFFLSLLSFEYRKATDLFKLILYPTTLLKLFISCRSSLIESFAVYSTLGWHLCYLRVCMTSAQALLAFIVSDEKSGVILIDLPVTCPYCF